VSAAAGSSSAFHQFGATDAVRDRLGDLSPPRRLVSIGLPVAGFEASSLSGLEHLAGQSVAVGGLGLGQLRRLDCFP
jgi:hypothetical protein